MTEVPSFYNVEFPMDYPIIAPFYADIDLRKAGQVRNFTDYTDFHQLYTLLLSCMEKSYTTYALVSTEYLFNPSVTSADYPQPSYDNFSITLSSVPCPDNFGNFLRR
jgi:hypothetical protein